MKNTKSKKFSVFNHILVKSIGVPDIKRLVDYAESKKEDTVLNELAEPFKKVLHQSETSEACPKCGKNLFLSDVPGYLYVCPECDENFY